MGYKRMNESQKDMENFLIEMAEQYQLDATKFTHDFIYKKLIQRGIYLNESKVKTTQWYPIWMANLGKLKNLDVYLPNKKQGFLQLRNTDPTKIDVESYIKIYIPLHRSHFNQCVQRLFTFLSEENIIHNSKIRNQIAGDAVVVRVTSRLDVDRITNFIKQDSLFDTALIKPNPFTIQKEGLAIVKDGNLSYNSILCYYIENYIKKEHGVVSLARFYKYVDLCYQESFKAGYHLSVLAHEHHIDYQFSMEEEYYKKLYDDKYITELLMSVLEGKNDFEEDFIPLYEQTKESKGIDELRVFSREKEQAYHEACRYLNQALEINLRLLGVNNTIHAFKQFVGYGSAIGFTRKERARFFIEQKVSRDVLTYILKELSPEDYVRMEAYNLGYIEKEIPLDAVDHFMNCLLESLVVTCHKYMKNLTSVEQKKRVKQLINLIKDGNFENITNDEQLRKKLMIASKNVRLPLLDKMIHQFMLEVGNVVEDEEEAVDLFSEMVMNLEFQEKKYL